jgi:hypothetical protein
MLKKYNTSLDLTQIHQTTTRARAAAAPPATQRALPVILGIAAFVDSVWLAAAVAALLSEPVPVTTVADPVEVPVEVPVVALAVVAETEAPVEAAAPPSSVAVT